MRRSHLGDTTSGWLASVRAAAVSPPMRRRCLSCAVVRPGAPGAGAEGRPPDLPSASPPAPTPHCPRHRSRLARGTGTSELIGRLLDPRTRSRAPAGGNESAPRSPELPRARDCLETWSATPASRRPAGVIQRRARRFAFASLRRTATAAAASDTTSSVMCLSRCCSNSVRANTPICLVMMRVFTSSRRSRWCRVCTGAHTRRPG